MAVDVVVAGGPRPDAAKLQQVYNVIVTAQDATSRVATFALSGFPRPDGFAYGMTPDGQLILGAFVYGTTADSGMINFKVEVKDGSLNLLASGSTSGTVQPGATIKMSVYISPSSNW